MAFRVGQKIICVRATWLSDGWRYVPNKPVEGGIYTVRGLQQERHFPGLLLEEIINHPILWSDVVGKHELSFPASRFRPLVERKTDISCFKAMLNPSLEDVANLILQEVTLCP